MLVKLTTVLKLDIMLLVCFLIKCIFVWFVIKEQELLKTSRNKYLFKTWMKKYLLKIDLATKVFTVLIYLSVIGMMMCLCILCKFI